MKKALFKSLHNLLFALLFLATVCSVNVCASTVQGEYPTQKGTILVTSDWTYRMIPTGHAAIVWAAFYDLYNIDLSDVGWRPGTWTTAVLPMELVTSDKTVRGPGSPGPLSLSSDVILIRNGINFPGSPAA